HHARPAVIQGVVRDSTENRLVSGCALSAGGARTVTSDANGRFGVSVDSLIGSGHVVLEARCRGYMPYSRRVSVTAGDTTAHTILLAKQTASVWSTITLPGDALFAQLQFELTEEGVKLVKAAGLKLRQELREGEMIVVQGHTDDLPIPKAYRKTNWMLSGERAAAAAAVLTDSAYGVAISRCHVAVMGFGESRPAQPDTGQISPAQRPAWRAANRRIELRRVTGLHGISGDCAP
ncbi:MAG: OmpA family protein, partial [Chloroflexota bacterium]|nr:OmpA family protein [Chloroflexota bacterium]